MFDIILNLGTTAQYAEWFINQKYIYEITAHAQNEMIHLAQYQLLLTVWNFEYFIRPISGHSGIIIRIDFRALEISFYISQTSCSH